MVSQILFTLLIVVSFVIAMRNYGKVRRNILLGKEEKVKGNKGIRWKRVFLIAFGQQKMFKRWIPAIFHFFIYAAFLITQVELIEILIDGFTGQHRVFANSLGSFYTFVISLIEVLSIGAFVATLIFLSRRNLLKMPRFHMDEMTRWPKLDGNLILYGEILLLIGIFSMNGADTVLQTVDSIHYQSTGQLAISSWLGPALFTGMSEGTLVGIERFGWWLHIIVVLGFLNYLPFSKHLHILLAFPNTYYAKTESTGKMDNMPEIMKEVQSMMGLGDGTEDMPPDDEIPEFGANDVFGLSWINLMQAYTCTECGRCTTVCPANLTGKKLSPRKVMMDVRDRAEEIGSRLDSGDESYIDPAMKNDSTVLTKENFKDGKSLFDYISMEELHACTTCNACVEACPVMINPMDIILQLRRYEILTMSAGPPDWLPMFNSIENSGSAWQIPDERMKWAIDMKQR